MINGKPGRILAKYCYCDLVKLPRSDATTKRSGAQGNKLITFQKLPWWLSLLAIMATSVSWMLTKERFFRSICVQRVEYMGFVFFSFCNLKDTPRKNSPNWPTPSSSWKHSMSLCYCFSDVMSLRLPLCWVFKAPVRTGILIIAVAVLPDTSPRSTILEYMGLF